MFCTFTVVKDIIKSAIKQTFKKSCLIEWKKTTVNYLID